MTFVYPTNAELQEIEQDFLPRLMADRPIFKILPIENVDDDLIIWEQQDNFIGLQQIRGINGSPGRVKKVGMKRWIVQPGYYGEDSPLNEHEITRRRRFGTFSQAIDLTDLVMVEQQKLLQRRLDRIEYIGWLLMTTGTFSVSSNDGSVVHTDTFNTQTYAAGVSWATVATASPLKDMRAMKLLARGHSISFGRDSALYVNQTTFNNALNNTNANDLGGKKLAVGASVLTAADMNKIFFDNDLPALVPMDDGYYDDAGSFQLFIADNKGVLVGKRKSGTPIGTYAMTRNANNPDCSPGSYTRVIDRGEMQVPRVVEVHDGHNGGPKLPFPSGFVTCSL